MNRYFRAFVASTPVPLLAGLFCLAPASEASPQEPAYFHTIVNYFGKQAGDPQYYETLMVIHYPAGLAPVSEGGSVDPRPVVVLLRGGNENTVESKLTKIQPMSLVLLQAGFVVAVPNYHVVKSGDPQELTTAGVARAVQYIRHNHEELNVEPEKLVIDSRSHGGVHGYRLSLGEEHQDLGSPDPMQHESSRPLALAVRSAPTLLTCFDPQKILALAKLLLFDDKPMSHTPLRTQFANSPSWALLNPEYFNRSYTPPILLVYDLILKEKCGKVVDPHDGYFGTVMQHAVDRFASEPGNEAFGAQSGFVDKSDLDEDGVNQLVFEGILERVGE